MLVRTSAEVSLGPAPRRGLAELDGEGETVGGIVVMRYGENALDVIDGGQGAPGRDRSRPARRASRSSPTYDRSRPDRARRSTRCEHTLIEEMIVVSLVIFLFLLHARSALVPILTLPLGVLLAFIPMFYQGLTANIMSLGGIAVAIGAMVDASIILIENIHKKLEHWEQAGRPGAAARRDHRRHAGGGAVASSSRCWSSRSRSCRCSPCEGTEGRLFKPLAFTKTYSMGFARDARGHPDAGAGRAVHPRADPRARTRTRSTAGWCAAYAPVVRFVVALPLAP